MRFLIVTGLSGAGKTTAIRDLEDLGALCVDNMPSMMIFSFLEACQSANMRQPLVAISADVRSGEFFNARAVAKTVKEARAAGYQVETLFLEASDESLVNRYKETRRDHPLAVDGVGLEEAIRLERDRLMPLRETASYLIDTTGMRPRALLARLRTLVDDKGESDQLSIEVTSFGFKRGLPREADLVLDVRFLPNPFYIPELGHHTGLDEEVRRFVLDHPVTQEFLKKTTDLLSFLVPNYVAEGKHRLVIAIGCTGGAHRSVAIAEYIGKAMQPFSSRVTVSHRDLAAEQAHWTTSAAEI